MADILGGELLAVVPHVHKAETWAPEANKELKKRCRTRWGVLQPCTSQPLATKTASSELELVA